MPVVVTGKITRPEQLVEALAELIEESTLPFEYVAKYDEELIPAYPAVQIQPGATDSFLHSTATLVLGLRAYLYVMHAKMTEDRRTRNLNDLKLATDLVQLLENSITLGGKVIHGFVENETPAVFPPRSNKGDAVVGTRLLWSGVQQRRFK